MIGNDFASSAIFRLDFGIKDTQGNMKMCGLYEELPSIYWFKI